MSAEVIPNYSHIRAVRQVEAEGSPKLIEFLERASTISDKVFGVKNVWPVRLPATLEETLQPGFEDVYEGAGVLNVPMFAAQSLRVTLFERRGPASDEFNDALTRFHTRASASTVSGGRTKHRQSGRRDPDRRPNTLSEKNLKRLEWDLMDYKSESRPELRHLTVSAYDIHSITSTDDHEAGITYALRINPDTPEAQVLQSQALLIQVEARRTVAGAPLFTDRFDQEADPLNIKFANVRNGSRAAHELFRMALKEVIITEGDVAIRLSDASWDVKTRSPQLVTD